MEPINKESSVRHISDIVGDFGPWQRNICLFCMSTAVFSAFNNLAGSFYAPTIEFHCSTDTRLPNREGAKGVEGVEGAENNTAAYQCFAGNSSQKCDEWEYDRSTFHSTIISQWDLVCDRSWLASFTQSIYMLGIVFSALIFGHLSDKYGRRPVLWASILIEIVAGLGSAFSTTVVQFTICRFFLAFGCYGRNLTGFLLGVECVGTKYRATMGIAYQLGWAMGYILLPVIAYVLKDYKYLLLATTLPEILWLFWLRSIPESPRWQMTNGYFVEAQRELVKALSQNGKLIEGVEQKFIELRQNMEKEQIVSKGSLFSLWKTATMRKYTLIFYFTWFVNAFVYYGISLNIGDFGGNLFVNFFLAGLVEFPSYFFCMFIIKRIGRRPLLALMMYGAGFSLLGIIPFITRDDEGSYTCTLILAMVGKFCVTSSFGIIYVYSAEVYPTVLRQIGVGSCSVAGRAGSILAPFIKELSQFTHIGVSMAIFGVLSIADGICVVFLPETRDKEMPDTLEDFEKFSDKKLVT